jgi:hypothetical protein
MQIIIATATAILASHVFLIPSFRRHKHRLFAYQSIYGCYTNSGMHVCPAHLVVHQRRLFKVPEVSVAEGGGEKRGREVMIRKQAT